jgi:DNA adenine methylase
MVKYAGGKTKISSHIFNVISQLFILAENKKIKINGYLEPFCGSLAITKAFYERSKTRIPIYASDYNKDLILLYKEIKKGTFRYPTNITKEQYSLLKQEKSSALRGFVGIAYSYGGGWFNGYLYGDNKRNYVDEAIRAFKDLEPTIKGTTFLNEDYKNLNPKNLFIYCDPPYVNTTQIYKINTFNTKEFWEIMRKWSKNNIVVVSELTAPSDFKCIWKYKYNTRFMTNDVSRTEKLFIHTDLMKRLRGAF